MVLSFNLLAEKYVVTLFSWVEKKNAFINPLRANPAKWSNTLKQFVASELCECV